MLTGVGGGASQVDDELRRGPFEPAMHAREDRAVRAGRFS